MEIFIREILGNKPLQQWNPKHYDKRDKERTKEKKKEDFAHGQSTKKEHGRKLKRLSSGHDIIFVCFLPVAHPLGEAVSQG